MKVMLKALTTVEEVALATASATGDPPPFPSAHQPSI